jgi:hypothetical protein
MSAKKRGAIPKDPKDVRNIRFQLAFSENEINAIGGKDKAYLILKKSIIKN